MPTSTAVGGPPPARPASLDAYSEAIAAYLTDTPGATFDCLQALLADWAMPQVQPADACKAGNVDDDAEDELVVVLSASVGTSAGASGTQYAIAVLDPSSDGYDVAFQTATYGSVPPGTTNLAPLLGVGDLNGDGGGEFAYQTWFCGEAGCLATAFVYKGARGEYGTVSPRDGISMGDGTFSITDTDGDGTMEVVATGGGRGTPASGPERPRTETWAWDGSFYALRSTVRADSPYLYHRIVDADALLQSGAYGGAEAAYMAAVDNALAQPWRPGTNELDELRAYGLFRAALARLMGGGDATVAGSYLERAKALGGTLHAQLAASFQAAYAAKGEVSAGCAAVRDDLRANDAEYAAFWDFGTDNPAYDARSMCPF